MTVLVIHNYYKYRGGEDAVFENETEYLEKSGHKVIRYIKNNIDTDNYSFLMKVKFFFKSIYNRDTVKDLKKILKDNKVDTAHIHNVFPLISCSAYRFLYRKKIKIIQTLHNYRFTCPNGLFFTHCKICTRCIKGNFFNCILFRCYKNSTVFSILYALIVFLNQKTFRKKIDKYIALTQFTKDAFIKAGFDEKKFYIKDNGFIDGNIKRRESRGYFLFLGRISFEKGIDFLLESFAEMAEINLIVAGTGDNLEYYKSRYGGRNILFKGFVRGDEKNKLLQEASALIVPSIWYEIYPVSIIEAFSLSVPVIAANTGGLPYIIKDGDNGLIFEPNDFDSFKNCIGKFKKAGLRQKLGDNARDTFLSRMEMSKNIKRLIEIYKE